MRESSQSKSALAEMAERARKLLSDGGWRAVVVAGQWTVRFRNFLGCVVNEQQHDIFIGFLL